MPLYRWNTYIDGRPASCGSKEYNAWHNMIRRCTNPNNPKYEIYGGRGIKVCDRWIDNFDAFFEDMGRAPSKEHTLDRINGNGNYEPGNVRWTDSLTQGRNRPHRLAR